MNQPDVQMLLGSLSRLVNESHNDRLSQAQGAGSNERLDAAVNALRQTLASHGGGGRSRWAGTFSPSGGSGGAGRKG